MPHFSCTQNDLAAFDDDLIRWLASDSDYEVASAYWKAQGFELSPTTWQKAHEFGYEYAGLFLNEKIVSMAAVWRFSEESWDVAAVTTLPGHRRKGYAGRVVGFVTRYILGMGKIPVVSTAPENSGINATLRKAGFAEIHEDRVWWHYPKLPEL